MRKWLATLAIGLSLGTSLAAQDTLSAQVLRLLTRVNTWTLTNTFLDLRLAKGVPSDTLNRFYEDNTGNLYFNGFLVAGVGGVTTPHNLLSTTHPDTLAGTVARGDVVIGNATPAWARLAKGTAGQFLRTDGTDVAWGVDGTALTNLPAANLTGTLSAISGVNLTALNATNLGSGTVPLARLSGITTTQLAAGAAITYAQLALTGGILNADISGSAAIVYSKLTLASSIVTGDIANGTILFADWSANGCTNTQVAQYNGTAWVCKTLASGDISGAGTVTSAALSLPAEFAVGGSPITTSGTFSVTWATQTANKVLASATSGGAATPAFRALVNADFPVTGVGAGSYPKVTVNTAGLVTAASTTITLTTDVAGVLPMANGGTGVGVSADDSVLVGSGTAWVAQTLPNCPTGALNYTQATNLFSCSASGGPTHSLLSATHTDTLAGVVVRGDLVVGNSTPAWTRLPRGTAGQFLLANGLDAVWGTTVSGLLANAAGTGTLGSTALPFASAILGTAATNTLSITPAAFAQGTVATVDDPALAAVKLPLVRRGTIAYTAGALSAGTCSAAVTATVTGLATTATVVASLNAAPGTQWQKGIYFLAYPTVNTVNIVVCNPTAGSITPDSATLNYTAVVP